MSDIKNAAGPSTLGFLYQVQYALYALMKEDREEAKLVIEGLDDIVIEGAGYVGLHQLKHHVAKQATLTAASPELWKTLGIWSTQLKAAKWKPDETKLALITTAKLSPDSLPTLLVDGPTRDTVEAHRLLLETAAKSKSESLQLAFDAFKALSKMQQMELLDAVYIYDQSPRIDNIPELIKKKELRWVSPTSQLDQIYDRLQSWWFEQAVSQLLGKSTRKIARLDVKRKLDSIVSEYQRDSLPLEYRTAQVDAEYVARQQDKMFVRQLKDINVNAWRIRNAVRDYFRAFEQRTKWVKDELLIDEDLHQYQTILEDAWNDYVAQLIDDLEVGELHELDEETCVQFGRRVLSWMEGTRIPIRESMPIGDEYVMRGSYHIMADAELPPIYWHPQFLAKLEQALASKS